MKATPILMMLVLGAVACDGKSSDEDADTDAAEEANPEVVDGDGVEADDGTLPDGEDPAETVEDGRDAPDDGATGEEGEAVEEIETDPPPEEIEPVCGNAITEEGEECDDGNEIPGDGCEPVTCAWSCHGHSECNDGHPCTSDECTAEHRCSNEASGTDVVCRPAVANCDLDDRCDGADEDCPAADAVQPATFRCRSAAGSCDLEEYCDGILPVCPTDLHRTEGTDCDDGNACTEPDACNAIGMCTGPWIC